VIGWIAWTVLCVSIGMVLVAALDDQKPASRVGAGVGFAGILWALGVLIVATFWGLS